MHINKLVKTYLEKQKLHSLTGYWYYFRLWLMTEKNENVLDLVDEVLEKECIAEAVKHFALDEQEVEKLYKGKLKTNTGTAILSKPKKFTQKRGQRYKVRDVDGRYRYRNNDSLSVDDVIISYVIFDSVTGDYTETTLTSDNFDFGGGGDFAGGGAGGGWTESTNLRAQELSTINNDVDSGQTVGAELGAELGANTEIYS